MSFAQKYPTLSKTASFLWRDDVLLTICLWIGIIRGKETLMILGVLGLLVVKYGNKPKV
jgi:hypothetical protein